MTAKSKQFSPAGAAALKMAVDSGMSPLDILDLHPVSGKVSARWLLVLHLLRHQQMTAQDISELLDVHPKTISKMLHNLDRLRKSDPKVMELIHRVLSANDAALVRWRSRGKSTTDKAISALRSERKQEQ